MAVHLGEKTIKNRNKIIVAVQINPLAKHSLFPSGEPIFGVTDDLLIAFTAQPSPSLTQFDSPHTAWCS